MTENFNPAEWIASRWRECKQHNRPGESGAVAAAIGASSERPVGAIDSRSPVRDLVPGDVPK
jgi:hypothetical protein